ncbi:MAG TPA: T9SS type A sorting domain-containing protein, partial [Flavobacterium sp.]|nr:T9SS type A sorting domain-containing protein [Flavobacterium sp.]
FHLECRNNQLTSFDVSGLNNLGYLDCSHNQLTSLFIKNNNTNYWSRLDFWGNPNLVYICADEEDIEIVQHYIKSNHYQFGDSETCHVNSYCSFNPGGFFYTINGKNKIDANNNGCDASDIVYPNLKYTITDGTISGNIISNTSGNYEIPVSVGTNTITPQIENPSYFTVSPANATVTFPTTASPFVQDFCITPNGVHHDLEVVIIPLVPARPGFDATYKIKYRNKGTVAETATLIFNFDDAVLDYISSAVLPTTQNTGNLTWNIGTLKPFENGEIVITLNVNSPMETPSVNGGDILSYSATFNSSVTDETPDDNTFLLNQTVVNSFDPNDKTCLEGDIIEPRMIGEYVHYKIRFENTGTYAAQNIVVKDMIDTTKFDISTLQMTDASHSCVSRISNPDKVEFIFENINLSFEDATNDGYVVFKIKTKPTLTIGETISNFANIYFDYNFPIVTNTATSTFQTLSNKKFDLDNFVTLSPNPAKEVLNITLQEAENVKSISIYNLLGQLVQITTSPDKTIDVSSLKNGNYIIQFNTEKGEINKKFIKE